MIIEISFTAYLVVSIATTVWVAHTLSTNGLVFLIDAFDSREELAVSINHMLVVGFYLVNIGFVLLALQLGTRPTDVPGAMEYVSTKVGLALLVLGMAHFGLMYVITRYGQHAARLVGPESEASKPEMPPLESA